MKRLLTLVITAIMLIATVSAESESVPDGGTRAEFELVVDHIVTVTTQFAASGSNQLRGLYTGTLVNGIPHGGGRLVHPDAIDPTPQTAQWYYEGEFANGTFHGWGTVWIRGEIEFRGELAFGDWVTPCIEWNPEWHANNNPNAGTLEHPLYVTDFDITITKNGSNVNGQFRGWYSGPLVEGLPHGSGVFAPFGDRNPSPQTSRWYYEGEFRNGLFHGQGRYYQRGELLHGGEFRFGDSVGLSDGTLTFILIVAGSVAGFLVLCVIASKVHHAHTLKSVGLTKEEWKASVDEGTLIIAKAMSNLDALFDDDDEDEDDEEDEDDDSQAAKIVTVRCCGCDTPTNVQVGKSEICKYCGNAVNASQGGGV